jgi:type 1 glutamine amidotransferase
MRLTMTLLLTLLCTSNAFAQGQAKPLKALLITGGCCHDYERQKKILSEGISARANVEWTVVHEGEGANKGGTKHKISIYEKDDWAKGYDVVVHNECFADVTDVPFVERVAKAHYDGVAAVVIHCTMHTFRGAKTDEWRKLLGVTSTSHEGARPELVRNLKPEHPIMKGFPAEWKTPNGELYIISKLWPETTPLAQAYGQDTKKDHTVIWTNQYGKARVLGTTLGHHNETMGHEVYLDFISRGLLWACDKLGEDGKPKAGYGAK